MLVESRAVVEFDSSIYGVSTVQKAALKFTDVCSFSFRSSPASVIVEINALPSASAVIFAEVTERFKNEVLDQHLRHVVAQETEVERNLILAYAFSNTKLVAS